MKKLLLAGAAIFLSVSSARALPTSFSVGGLTFSNITCTVATSVGTVQGNCGALTLQTAPGGNGLEIAGTIASFSGSQSSLDILFSYQLASTTPLASVGLSFNGATIGSGIASATVVETASTAPGGTVLGQTKVSTPSTLSSTIPLSPSETSLYLVKDINLTTFPDPSGALTEAIISFIDQTFPIGGGGGGGGTPVPEPTAMALLGVGLLGLGLARRKRA